MQYLCGILSYIVIFVNYTSFSTPPLTYRHFLATIEQIDFRNYKELTYVTR